MKRLPTLFSLALLAIATGCSYVTTPKTTRNVSLPEAKPDQALVVVIRPKSVAQSNIGFPIEVDGSEIGRIASNSFMYFNLTPGSHEIRIIDPEPIKVSEEGFEPLRLDLKPGSSQFYLIEWYGRSGTSFVDTGRIFGNGWQKISEAIAREDLEDVANTPTDEQYEKLQAQGLIEFERKSTAR